MTAIRHIIAQPLDCCAGNPGNLHMTKQCDAKLTLVNGRKTSRCRAIGGYIGAAYGPNKHDLIGLAIIETPKMGNVVCGNVGLNAINPMGAFDQTEKTPTFPLWPGFSVISLATGHASATDDGRLI